jgi:hypothetical protein
MMTSFSEVVAAADGLSLDEQATLLELLRHRVAERNRAAIAGEAADARAEFANGRAQSASAKQIMDEARGEA